MTWHLTVLGDPIPKARPRTMLTQGKARTFTPRATLEAQLQIRDAFCERYPGHVPLAGPLKLWIRAYLRQPLSIPKSRRLTALPSKKPDSANLACLVADALEGAAYVNDSQLVMMAVEKLYAVESPPRWEIALSEVEP